jgi:hypothetical protein
MPADKNGRQEFPWKSGSSHTLHELSGLNIKNIETLPGIQINFGILLESFLRCCTIQQEGGKV